MIAGPVRIPKDSPFFHQGEDLNRFAEPHIVCKTAAEAELLKEVDPAQPFPLVGAKGASEFGGRIRRGDTLKSAQSLQCSKNFAPSRLGCKQNIQQIWFKRSDTGPFLVPSPANVPYFCTLFRDHELPSSRRIFRGAAAPTTRGATLVSNSTVRAIQTNRCRRNRSLNESRFKRLAFCLHHPDATGPARPSKRAIVQIGRPMVALLFKSASQNSASNLRFGMAQNPCLCET
jgi:hypothetical protein